MIRILGCVVAVAVLLTVIAPTEMVAQEYCPANTACVQSTTLLTYDAGTAKMDGYTWAIADYGTAYWYGLCANLAIIKMDGTLPYGWSTPWPAGAPVCVQNTSSLSLSGDADGEPGIYFVAIGSAMVEAVFLYRDIVFDCYIYCDGYWDDEYAYSMLDISQPPVYGPSRPSSATVAPFPMQSTKAVAQKQRDLKGSTQGSSTPMPNLLLTYNDNPISQGSTAWIWNDQGAQGAPRMPPVIARLSPNNFNQQVRWWVSFAYTGGDNVARVLKTPVSMDPNVPNYKYTAANGTNNLLTDTGTVAGGLATIYWKVGNGPEQQAPLNVHGTNPDRTYVKNLLGGSPWFLQQLAAHESGGPCAEGGMRQFYSPPCSTRPEGRPTWGTPHGFGVMQVDPPPTYVTLWDWTVNVSQGKQKLASFLATSQGWWDSQRQQYEQFKATHPAAKPPCEILEGNAQQCRFGYTENSATGTHSYLDAVWMKVYNGASPHYISWAGTGNLRYWKVSRYGANGKAYVNEVCSTTIPNTP
ncbi:MAG: hypothetical protein JST93_14695 [Acidobacteria bacterium]|nr:hypothetical protein [Acidobacteriota bacterium]